MAASSPLLPLFIALFLLCFSSAVHGLHRTVVCAATAGSAVSPVGLTAQRSRFMAMMHKCDDSDRSKGRIIPASDKNIDSTTKLAVAMLASSFLFIFPFAYIPSVNAIDSADLAIINTARPILDTFINVMSVFFLVRVVVSWYPKTDLKKMPYNLATWATEPILSPLREILPPAFGVDISPIACIMVLSFIREVLVSQQGILSLLEKSAI